MVNYEGQRETAEAAQVASVLPVPFRAGDFSSVSTAIKDPRGGVFPGNIIPANRLDPIALRYLNFHVLPNQGGQANLAGVESQINNINQVFVRGDHNFSAADRLFSRVAIFNYDFPTTPLDIYSPLDSRITARNAVIGETHVFSPTVLNEAKFGFNRNWILRKGLRTNTDFDPESIGLTGVRSVDPNTGQSRKLNPLETGLVPMLVTGYLTMGDGGLIPDFNVSETWQLVDNLTMTRGVHTFKTGFDFRRFRMDRSGSNNARGQFQFNGQVTGNAAADFVLGFPSLSQTPDGILPVQYRQKTYAG
jgi:hypothetical protein